MIAPVGTLVRHRLSNREGRVVHTPFPGVNSTVVDFGNSNHEEFPDGELEIRERDQDIPRLTTDGTHCHISTGPQWSALLRDFFTTNGVDCVLSVKGIGDLDLIDFGKVAPEAFQGIQELFSQWRRAHGV